MAAPRPSRALLLLFATSAVACTDTSTGNQDATTKPDTAESAERRYRNDADHDGYAREPRGLDCDDTRAAVNPGATETCATAYDDNCDGSTNDTDAVGCTVFYADADGDGYGSAVDSVCTCVASGAYDSVEGSDCNDADPAVNPAQAEILDDGIDQNCDGVDASAGGDTTGGGGDTIAGDAPLYGFWGLNGYLSSSGFADVKGRMGISVVQMACASPGYCVNTLLPMIRAAGLHATFRMTPSSSYYTTSGSFDLAKWKAQLDNWDGYDVQQFVDDGTLVGHMVLDDIRNYTATDPTAADLDEMAHYSKQMFPGLMTFVRERATYMPTPASGEYVYVDACVNQYRARDGEIHTYADAEEAEALSMGLGVINGLNLADGGDGSSGQPGWRTDGSFWAMSADEITEYGDILAAVPSMGMFLAWEYDAEEQWSDGTIGADYLDQPDVEAALADLALVVGSHPHVTLLKP